MIFFSNILNSIFISNQAPNFLIFGHMVPGVAVALSIVLLAVLLSVIITIYWNYSTQADSEKNQELFEGNKPATAQNVQKQKKSKNSKKKSEHSRPKKLKQSKDITPHSIPSSTPEIQNTDIQAKQPEISVQAPDPQPEYRPEPRIKGPYYDTLETMIAIHSYRDICLHIEKAFANPETYSTSYSLQSNGLHIHLHSPEGIRVVNIENMFLHFNGRFDELLKLWGADCAKIAALQKHLSNKKNSIYPGYSFMWDTTNFYKPKYAKHFKPEDLGFLRYTASFWASGPTCKLLNCFIWSKFSAAYKYCDESPHDLDLLLVMGPAFAMYLSMVQKVQQENRKLSSQLKEPKILRRQEGNFCSYNTDDVIDSRIFRPFSKKHPSALVGFSNDNIIVLKNYTGPKL